MSKERLFVVGLIAFAAIQSVLLVASCRQGPTKNLQVESLELVSGGKRLASLKTSKDGEPQFEMYDETGRTRLALEIFSTAPMMRMLDENGIERILIYYSEILSAISLHDEKRNPLLLISEADGEALMVIREPGPKTPKLVIGKSKDGMYIRHTSGDGKVTQFPSK